MPDVFSKAKRSDVMSRIRSRANRDTELALVRMFRAHGITGWRRHVEIRNAERGARNKEVRVAKASFRTPGSALRAFSVRPDFVFPKLRVAVFVDGRFWHCCPLHATKPRNNATFWWKKLASNTASDRFMTRTLRLAKWRVLRLWEHEPRKFEARLAARLRHALKVESRSTSHPGTLPKAEKENARRCR